ncbi:hypothetical protein, partial [Brevibacterium linens]|uniref:hypothetical protein n=1 Tax=Brevibacterium linens TaxID=1703 RepID=UPI003F8C5D44
IPSSKGLDLFLCSDAHRFYTLNCEEPSNPGVLTGANVILQWHQAVFEGSRLPEFAVMAEQANQVKPAYGEPIATLVMARALTLAERYDDAREILGEFLQFPGARARLWSDIAMHSQFCE